MCSDTISSTLTNIFYELCQHPEIYQQLRKELDLTITPNNQFSESDLTDCKLLDGIINETLRMHPPIPSGPMRVTPPEGLFVDNMYIPGNTNISVCPTIVENGM